MNRQKIVIKAATPGDIDELVRLEQKSFSTADGLLSRRSFRYHIKRHNLCLLARELRTGDLAGYVLVLVYRFSARVHSLTTDRNYRNQGIARMLLEHAFKEIQSSGIDRVHLEVRTRNAKARSLYRSLGFEVLGTRVDYYGPGQNAIRMRCQLQKV